jgi:phosphotransferase system enzyme I (PtsI)
VDRTNQELAYLASPFHPAILMLIRGVVQAAERHGKPVSVCGAMASDPAAAAVLVGLGLRQLSTETSSVLEVKAALARISCEEARAVAERALECLTTTEAERVVQEGLAPYLGDLFEVDAD